MAVPLVSGRAIAGLGQLPTTLEASDWSLDNTVAEYGQICHKQNILVAWLWREDHKISQPTWITDHLRAGSE